MWGEKQWFLWKKWANFQCLYYLMVINAFRRLCKAVKLIGVFEALGPYSWMGKVLLVFCGTLTVVGVLWIVMGTPIFYKKDHWSYCWVFLSEWVGGRGLGCLRHNHTAIGTRSSTGRIKMKPVLVSIILGVALFSVWGCGPRPVVTST